MGIQLIGNSGTIIGAGEEARKSLHVQNMPIAGNHYRYAGFTGTIGAALAANSELFQFRFVSGTKSYALVHYVRCDGIGIVAAATAAGPLGFYMTPARVWTAVGSGGTRIATTGDNLQTETAIAGSQVADIGIASTGALTAGTKTHDANSVGQHLLSLGTLALTGYPAFTSAGDIYNAPNESGQPLVLANQEGFTIRTTHAGPATMTYVVGFTVAWTEVSAF